MNREAEQEAEMAVVGSLLADSKTIAEVGALLRPEDFAAPEHRKAYAAILELDAAGAPVSLQSVAMAGVRMEALVAALGSAITPGNVGYYAKRLALHARRARAAHALARLAVRARSPEVGDGDFLDEFEQAAAEIGAASGRAKAFTSMREALGGVWQAAENSHGSSAAAKGLSELVTGFGPIDAAIGGLRSGNLAVIAGRPGGGKTSLAMQAIMNSPPSSGWLVFSAEMEARELAERVLQIDGVNIGALRKGRMTLDDWKAGACSVSKHSEPVRIWIDDMSESGAMTVAEIRTAAKYWVAKHGAQFSQFGIVIDYFQLIKVSAKFRREGLDQASRDLKALAKQLGCPILLVAQLNRDVEKESRRPLLSDLRECGQLEADADVVLFVYRPEMHATEADDLRKFRGQAELIVAKNRHGATGIVRVLFNGDRSRFEEIPPKEVAEAPPVESE